MMDEGIGELVVRLGKIKGTKVEGMDPRWFPRRREGGVDRMMGVWVRLVFRERKRCV